MTALLTCTRRIEFDAAHRLRGHEGKCRNLHGHRYVVEASFSAPQLDELGRLIDFGIIKQRLGEWIDTNWDHTVILWDADNTLGGLVAGETGQTIFYMPVNPTAENMALYLFEEVCPKLFADVGITCSKIRLYETPNCYVDIGI